MSYGWRTIADQGVELCDECGFDARTVVDEAGELDTVFESLAALEDHPDAGRRPEPETWSAQEYLEHCVQVTRALLEYVGRITGIPVPAITDLASARAGSAAVVPDLDATRRTAVLSGEYPFDVTAEWIVRHLEHDLEHHVLDIRRGYARLAMADHPEVHTITR